MSSYKKHIYKLVEKNKFFILFILMLLWLLIDPFIHSFSIFYTISAYIYLIITLVIIYAIRPNAIYFIISSAFLILSIIMPTLNTSFNLPVINLVNLIVEFIVNILITINIIWYTAAKKVYSKDDIFAGILAFLLIGGCFADIYHGLHYFDSAVVHFAKSTAGPLFTKPGYINFDIDDFLYFSYMTLTTVGYGDIYPVSNIAKRLCSIEACTGVLYLAVFIGRMVVLYEEPEKTEKSSKLK